MNRTATRFVRFGAGVLALVILGWILAGNAKPGEEEMPYHTGVPTDWSHSHVIFSRPASDEQARELGKEPRYWQQLYRRELQRTLAADPGKEVSAQVEQAVEHARSGGLWSEDLGTGAAPGDGNYPAKYGYSLTTANCASATTPDYVVYSTGIEGSAKQASIVAYDNIYSGCSKTVPTVYWAYNTGGTILTSPVISLDGTQVAFVQSSSAETASLVLLRWTASTSETVSSPGVPTSVTPTEYHGGCKTTLPCMTEIFLADGDGVEFNDTTSSLYYDFAGDIGWVGGETGWLVKLTGLFNGTPAEVTSGGFPVHVNPSNPNALTGPVYDHSSTNVFVGDAGGYFYKVASSNGAVTKSAQLDFGAGLVSSPVLDQTNGFIYAFASSDGTTDCTGGAACAAVYALTTNFAVGSGGLKTTVGQSVVYGTLPNPNPLYLGGLDSTYFNSVGGTGNMYVCGNTGADPTLYRIPITAGDPGTAVAVAALTPTGKNPSCSPVTDFPNPNIGKLELLFFSVQDNGHPCSNKGCLMNFVSLPWTAKTTFAQGQQILALRSGTTTVIETAIKGGTSGGTQPDWPAGAGNETTDGTVTWANQGATTVTALGAWAADHKYAAHDRINDGVNIEAVTVAGTSGATAPTWNTTIGGTTTDNTTTWINVGPWPNVGLTVTGGTGGVIIDNTVTSDGGSQVYFFTLGNNTCTSGGTGGCAMQVSQSSLN